MSSLRERRCTPCTGATPKLDADAIAALLPQLPGWTVRDERLHRTFSFGDFAGAIAFVNRMAEVAELEDHHPDFTVHYREVEVTIWTHAVGGLSENDFILAAKIDGVTDGTKEMK
jgi:4a-hydroxytetrahydrobiopterin dehydratase